ncbi:hypothetical protein [Sulfurisphaera ohwakuensis]|uniref:Membrane protein YqaA with SNARE-associated domain n=1 Tax=Sulfurisphaera ohwakuensis TaxID=69656 RepID=A0A650CJ73_SULOH|nr:hypothetical protein [Sulfurisphaera ohwakuensis]MBB5253469.1 membrane protein YqaA with SNARE-associated domain [Sulfurisphaera ohwakuensis]QGR17778.1 hypothetical protein D1869_11770 [Sulfurisphaera ohwakuensis]
MDIPLQILILIFLISFITNILPFAGAPYTLIATNFLLAYGENIENILIVIFLSGTGAALAKTITYVLGIALKKPLRKNKNIPLINKFIKSKYFPLALFITAILPGLPLDDYLYIGGGIVKESLKKMLIITIPSKILKSSIEIPLELFGILKISDLFNLNPLFLSILLTIIFFIIGFLLIKIDWNSLYEKISEKYLNKRI